MPSRLFSVNLGGGSGSSVTARASTVAIGNGVQNFSVAFSSTVSTTAYTPLLSIGNDVDADPIYLTAIWSNRSATGFDVELSAPTDSANYVLSYIAILDI